MGVHNTHPCDSAIFLSLYIYIGRKDSGTGVLKEHT